MLSHMHRVRTTLVAFAALAASACAMAPAAAILSGDTGSLTTPTGVSATGDWVSAEDGFRIDWAVQYNAGPNTWTYTYNIYDADGTRKTAAATSHFLLEVSSTFTRANIISISASRNELNEWEAGQSGNPQLPFDLYGIKFDAASSTYTITSDRAPMWGSFYAKGPSGTSAWNAGLGLSLTNVDRYLNPNGLALIAVPDTTPTQIVPVPAASLGGLVLFAALGAARKRTAAC